MEANKTTLHTILNAYYQVPSYQRLYSWDIANWEELLKNFLLGYKKTYKNEEGYFLGSLIIKRDEHKANTNDVIDGQQRLTTISILLKVIADLLFDNEDSFNSAKTMEYITEQTSKDVYKNRLKHIKLNDKDGVDAINYDFILKNDCTKIQSYIEKLLNEKQEISKILKCYLYFYYALKGEIIEYKKFKINYKEDEDYQNLDTTNLLSLKDFIINKCQLIIITLSYNEDEQEIFNTMNSTGLELNTGDLVKNYFFSDKNIADKYIDKWQEIFESTENRINIWSNDLDQILFFIQLYHEAQGKEFTTYNQETNYRNLFKLYKKNNNNKQLYVEQILDMSAYYYSLYENNHNLNSEDLEKLTFLAITQSGFTSLLSIIFFVKLHPNLSKEYKDDIYLLTLQLVFIWSILSLPSNKLSKFISQLFSNLHKNFEDGIVYFNKFIKDNLKDVSFKELEDIEFNISQARHKKKLALILSFLEMLHIGKDARCFEYTNESIEHIIPRKKYFENGYKLDNKLVINYLGNYTFLSISLNASAGTQPFKNKKEIYKKIPYVITQNLTHLEDFNEEDAITRTKQLYDKLDEFLKIKQFFND